jgi:hypothetical protein
MELEFREARLPNIVATSEARAPASRSWLTGYVPKALGESGWRRHLIRLDAPIDDITYPCRLTSSSAAGEEYY